MNIQEAIQKIAAEHPYQVKGDFSSYSDYNQGWEDACARIEAELEEGMFLHIAKAAYLKERSDSEMDPNDWQLHFSVKGMEQIFEKLGIDYSTW